MTQLPLGQIRPAAQPVNAFFQPGKANVAAATAQPSVPQMPRLGTQTQRGGFNVQGYNSFDQLAKSLSVFSKEALSLGKNLALNYVSDQIKAGYEDEVKNQTALAAVNIQNDLEEGAVDAANEISELQKVDPPAAQLLTDSNPYRLIGRRRAAAQFAAQRVRGVLAGDLIDNASQLELIKPGSPELTQRRAQLTRQIAQSVGFNGTEPEFIKYVVKEINEGWDNYISDHTKLYKKASEETTKALMVTTLIGEYKQYINNGIRFADGQVIEQGHPQFLQMSQLLLTRSLDKHLAVLDAEQRTRVRKAFMEEVIGNFAEDPFAMDVFRNLKMGNPNMPYEKRPTFGQAMPQAIRKQRVSSTRLEVDMYDLQQRRLEQNYIQSRFFGPNGLGRMDRTDPGYESQLRAARELLISGGHTNPDKFLKDILGSASDFVDIAQPLDVADLQSQRSKIIQTPLSEFQGESVTAIEKNVRDYIDKLPTAEQRKEASNELYPLIDRRTNELQNLRSYANPAASTGLRALLGTPEMKALLGDEDPALVAQQLQQMIQGGTGINFAEAGVNEEDAQIAVNTFIQQAKDAAQKELGKLGMNVSDIDKENAARDGVEAYLKSDEYKALVKSLKPDTPPPQTNNVPAGPQVYQKNQTSELSDDVIKNYAQAPVMSGEWVVSELRSLEQGKPVSQELSRAAERAGVTPLKYLYEHLRRYYSRFDPKGDARRELRQLIRKERQDKTVSFNQPGMSFDGQKVALAANDISKPGGWMMTMVAGYMTPEDRKMLRDWAEQLRRLNSPAGRRELEQMNIRYRNYGMHFPLA